MKKSILLIALLLGIMSSAKADDGITIATYGNATGNTTRTMTLAVTHTTNNYVAFQLDLTLPEGTKIDATKITAKTPMLNSEGATVAGTTYENTNFIFDGATQSDGTYRIIGYNMTNHALAGSSGDICLTVPLTTTEGVAFDASDVTAGNIIFVESTNLTGTTLTSTTDYRLWGDVVKDKVIDGKDVQAIADIVAKNTTSGDIDTFAADTDQNDNVDGVDLQKTADVVAGN